MFIYTYYTASKQKNLTIISCIFNGLGEDMEIGWMINTKGTKDVIIRDCIFQNVTSHEEDVVSLEMTEIFSKYIVENCLFSNIRVSKYNGISTLHIFILKGNSKLIINGNKFENCESPNVREFSIGAMYLVVSSMSNQNNIINITNNKFIHNNGITTGGIYANINTYKYNFANNEFSRNQRKGAEWRGNDVYLIIKFPKNWTMGQEKNEIMTLLNGSISSDQYSIYYMSNNNNSDFINLPQKRFNPEVGKKEL